jgi:hypothetical protein
MKKFLNILCVVLLPVLTFSQARIIFNGANIYITNDALLVIDNPAPDALTSIGSGGIVSEGASNNLIWNLGTQAATYKIPFVSGNYPIPIFFTTSGGIGNGSFKLSTYSGPDWENSQYLPPGVTNVDRDGTDNSAHVIDRFWQINAFGYAVQPTLSNLTFSYKENEWNEAGNSITEGDLEAQNWNSVSDSWIIPPVGVDNISTNQVVLTGVDETNYYSWWTLVSSDFDLPLTLLSFTAEKYNENGLLKWLVTAQVNVDFYEIQRSINGNDFAPVGKVASVLGSGTDVSYTYTDTLNGMNAGLIYYRLRMVDRDGKFSFSPVKYISFTGNNPSVQVSPNPVTTMVVVRFGAVVAGPYQVSFYNTEGRRLMKRNIDVSQNSSFNFPRSSTMPPGTYVIVVSGGNIKQAFTVIYH